MSDFDNYTDAMTRLECENAALQTAYDAVYTGAQDWMTRAITAEAELAALRADAERYRWLRLNPDWIGFDQDMLPQQVDAAIDAERGTT